MEQRLTLHIVDRDSRSRAEQARTAFALGHHAEVYSDLGELFDRIPSGGIVLLRQQSMEGSPAELFDHFGELGIWLPLIVCDEGPQIERVISAIKGGALDYLQLPLETGRLARSLARVADEAHEQGLAHRRIAEARRRISKLSKREREVLELLALGFSNKLIARDLSISPRTVEIHRSNMMTKLRSVHAAEAVRLWLQSGLEVKIPEPSIERELEEVRGLSLYPDIARLIGERAPGLAEPRETGADDQADDKTPGVRRAGSR
jgi:two-component system response regulator FixJ